MYYNIFVHIYQLLHRALLLKYGNKKALENASNALLVEHLENNAPLIFDEIRRWRYLLWDDYIEYKREQERSEKLLIP